MTKAKFIYVDKQKNIYPFLVPVYYPNNNNFTSEQTVQLKDIGLTVPKLYELIEVKKFIPRLHHSKPTVIFDSYVEVAEQDKKHSKYINLLNSLEEDCNMAISGEWDCSSDEGKEGFEAMISNINEIRNYLQKL